MLRRQYFRDLLIRERRLTAHEPLLTNDTAFIAKLCRVEFNMTPAQADHCAQFATNIPDVSRADLETLDTILNREN